MFTLRLFALLFTATTIAAGTCPQKFLRLSDHHSYCLPPNTQCKVLRKGISEEDKAAILEEHNALRSKLAKGLETKGGGLPAASNMLEMVWDETLADIAQKWTDQCNFNHDCGPCRSVPDYVTGQNLAQGFEYCKNPNCKDESLDTTKPDWKGMVDLWYSEVSLVNSGLISKNVFSLDWGHFTQVAWAQTWRVGCGYAAYATSDGKWIEKLYSCDYGPTGNYANQPIYDSGPACNTCPLESTCTSQGLCKLNNPNKAPVSQKKVDEEKKYIFNCDFRNGNPDCAMDISGTDNWYHEPLITGTVFGIVLQGGQKSTLTFKKKITPTGPSCLVFVERNGANTFGQQVAGKVSTDIQQPPSMPSWLVDLTMGGPDFLPMKLSLQNAETTVTISFTVPRGAADQYVEFKQIYAYPGECN